jgi:hypothetical protein
MQKMETKRERKHVSQWKSQLNQYLLCPNQCISLTPSNKMITDSFTCDGKSSEVPTEDQTSEFPAQL